MVVTLFRLCSSFRLQRFCVAPDYITLLFLLLDKHLSQVSGTLTFDSDILIHSAFRYYGNLKAKTNAMEMHDGDPEMFV